MHRVLLWHWGRLGGGPRYTLDLARAMQRRGDLALSLSLSRRVEILDDAQAIGIPVHLIDTYRDMRSALIASARLPVLRRQFQAEIARGGYDTVIATMSHLWNPAMVGAIASAGARLVTVMHDAAPHPGERIPFRRSMLAHEIAHSDRVVTLSHHVAGQVTALYGYPAARIDVIPHGIFRYAPGPIGLPEFPVGRPFRFLFFGRLLAYKGLDLLLDAVDLIDPALPVEIAIVGSGDIGDLGPRIAASSRVRLDRRWIPEGDIAEIFEQADAVVLPYREASQSGVLAAAYGAGLPMIATPVGGLGEQIVPFDAGLVALDLSPAAFAHEMTKLATDATLYRRLAANAVRTAEGPLGWDAIAGQFAEMLHALPKPR